MDTPSGKIEATEFSRFVTAYVIGKTDRGVTVDGAAPDGRCTGTCDRCGTAIMRVFCFAKPGDLSRLMHVGIDCAQKMGVPLSELRNARGFFAKRKREAEYAAHYASQAERRAQEEAAKIAREAERQENLRENAAFVAALNNLHNHPHASKWEKDQLELMVGATANQGTDWLDDPENVEALDGLEYSRHLGNLKLRTRLNQIQTRLSLCDTSKPSENKTIIGTFTAYRDCLVFDGVYGRTFRNFLTDGNGNAFVYKGTAFGTEAGDKVSGTFSNGDSETYEGLTSTVLTRPRKTIIARASDI
jgi:hypothetical protein